jgi:NAD(P)-dependent dehydrogenase (short-subunit alcohol dehydrogenase family)
MSRRFDGASVLISGAAGGFGAGAARAFAAEGAKLLLTDLREETVGQIAEETGAVALAGDVSDPGFHAELVVKAKDAFGRLDIAVNNAGIVHDPQPLPAISPDLVRRVIDVDLLGVMWAMQAQIPQMAAQGQGAIVNIASVAGLGGAPGLSAYAAAKHGVVGLTKSAAVEVARFGIRINAVCPAFARTAMVESVVKAGDTEAEKNLTRGIPMRRVGEVAEIVPGILWAADPANSFMTGETITLDGGLSAM